jgi:hypothetical protein
MPKTNVYSDDGNSGSKKCKRVYGGFYGVTWQSVRFVGVWIQAAGFVLILMSGMSQ